MTDCGCETTGSEDEPASESVGVPVPEEHVGVFVAEAFEDPERDTDWGTVVDRTIADDAMAEWGSLSPAGQVRELLEMAADYDHRAVEYLERIPTDRPSATDRIDRLYEEATRCRRNADVIRDGIADAFGSGYVEDEALVEAVERAEFDTATIADREDALESVAATYEYDFRPYGGTLIEPEGATEGSHEVW